MKSYLVPFPPFFLAQKTHFQAGRSKNKENRLLYFGLRILLTTQVQLLDIEKKIDSPSLYHSGSQMMGHSFPLCRMAQKSCDG
jgi:hypothetical protein